MDRRGTSDMSHVLKVNLIFILSDLILYKVSSISQGNNFFSPYSYQLFWRL